MRSLPHFFLNSLPRALLRRIFFSVHGYYNNNNTRVHICYYTWYVYCVRLWTRVRLGCVCACAYERVFMCVCVYRYLKHSINRAMHLTRHRATIHHTLLTLIHVYNFIRPLGGLSNHPACVPGYFFRFETRFSSVSCPWTPIVERNSGALGTVLKFLFKWQEHYHFQIRN